MEGEENKKINIMTNGKKWSENDKKKLIQLYQLGYKFYEIAVKMDRSRFAVQSEMRLLRLQGRTGYRTIESEAAAAEKKLFSSKNDENWERKCKAIEKLDNYLGNINEGAERAERKAITEDQMTDINQNDCPDNIREAMTAKTERTNTIFNEILENIRYTHDKKNDDYKDSYSDTMKRFGTKSGLVRIYDKFNRIENILDSEGKENFESAEDNLQDLATYAIMMLAYIKKGGDK